MEEEDKIITFNQLKLFDTIMKLSFHKYNKDQNNHIHLQYLERNNKGDMGINSENYKIKYYLKYNFNSNEFFDYNLEEIQDSKNVIIGTIYKTLLEKNIKEFNDKIKECIMNNIFKDDSIQKEGDAIETLDSRLEQTLTDEGQKMDAQKSSMEQKNAEYEAFEASQHKIVKKEE